MKFLLFVISLLTAFTAPAQTPTGRLTGQALDARRQPLPFATVLLRPAAADTSRLLVAQAGADGRFAFPTVVPGRYRLTVQALGYQPLRTAPFAVAAPATTAAPALLLQPAAQALTGVEVVGQKPLLEMSAGKLVVNVAGSLTAGATALEALEKVPGLVVINNRLSLAGQEGVTVLLDGRPTRYTDVVAVLRDFPSSSIERIEVLTQPGASHDAAGSAGIINIILKKNADLGTNATLGATAGYGRFGKGSATLDLNHRTAGLNVFGSYGYSARRTYDQLDTERRAAQAEGQFAQQSYTVRTSGVQTFRLGADYSLSPRQTLGVLLSGFDNCGQALGQSRTAAASGTTADTRSSTDRRLNSYAANANYKLRLDTLGRELTLDADVSDYESASRGQVLNTVTTSGPARQEQLRNDQGTRIGLRSAKADYRQPLPAHWTLSLGTKLSQAAIVSTLDLSGSPAVQTNRFDYRETITAAYAEAAGQALGLALTAGLRTEWTRTNGTSTADARTVQRAYYQFFPSLSLERVLSKKLALNLAYSRRLDRPNYQDLNPSLVYLDPYTSQRGNPFLRPATTGSYQLALTYQKQPFFVLGYTSTRDAISLVTATQDSAVYSTTANLDQLRRYSATLNLPLNLGKRLSGYAGVNVYHLRYDSPYLGATYAAGRTSATAYGQLTALLGAGFKAEASGYYQTAGLNGLIGFQGFGVLNLGLQRPFYHDRATLRLTLNDVFFGNRQRGTVRYQELDLRYLSYSESRQLRLSFTYKLGNSQLKAARKRATGLDEERGRVKAE